MTNYALGANVPELRPLTVNRTAGCPANIPLTDSAPSHFAPSHFAKGITTLASRKEIAGQPGEAALLTTGEDEPALTMLLEILETLSDPSFAIEFAVERRLAS